MTGRPSVDARSLLRATSARPKDHRSSRSLSAWADHRQRSRPTSTTRRMPRKDLPCPTRERKQRAARRAQCAARRSSSRSAPSVLRDPFGKLGATSRRSAGSGRLFGAHNSAVGGRPRPAVDAATATVATQSSGVDDARDALVAKEPSSAAFAVSAGERGGLGGERSVRGSEHARDRRTGPGLRHARDPKPVTLIERQRPRIRRLKERRAVIGVDAHQALPE